jgi:hypothetical protein
LKKLITEEYSGVVFVFEGWPNQEGENNTTSKV